MFVYQYCLQHYQLNDWHFHFLLHQNTFGPNTYKHMSLLLRNDTAATVFIAKLEPKAFDLRAYNTFWKPEKIQKLPGSLFSEFFNCSFEYINFGSEFWGCTWQSSIQCLRGQVFYLWVICMHMDTMMFTFVFKSQSTLPLVRWRISSL